MRGKKFYLIILLVILGIFLIFLFCKNVAGRNIDNNFMDISLQNEAEKVLEPINSNEEIIAFHKIYNIYSVMDFSSNKDCIKKLKEVKKILISQNISTENIEDIYIDDYLYQSDEIKNDEVHYERKRAINDLNEIFNVLVSPLLYKEYGDNVIGIQNIEKKDIMEFAEEMNFQNPEIEDWEASLTQKKIKFSEINSKNTMKFNYYENGKIKRYSRNLSSIEIDDEELAKLNEIDKEEKDLILDEKNNNQLILLSRVLENDIVMDQVFGNEKSLKLKKFLSSIDLDYLKKNSVLSNEDSENEYGSPYTVFFRYEDTGISLFVWPLSMSIDIYPDTAAVRDDFEEKVYTVKCCYFKDIYSKDIFLNPVDGTSCLLIDDEVLSKFDNDEIQDEIKEETIDQTLPSSEINDAVINTFNTLTQYMGGNEDVVFDINAIEIIYNNYNSISELNIYEAPTSMEEYVAMRSVPTVKFGYDDGVSIIWTKDTEEIIVMCDEDY